MSHFISRFFILDKSPLAIQHYFPADLNTLVSSRILAHTFNCFVYDYCGVFMPGGSSRAATGDARTTFLAGQYSEISAVKSLIFVGENVQINKQTF